MPNPPRQPIPPQVLGFKNSRILDLNLIPFPLILKENAETLDTDNLNHYKKDFHIWSGG